MAQVGYEAGAIKRYNVTAEHRSAFLGQVRSMVQGKMSELHHAKLRRTRIKKDEEAASAVFHLIQGWINPFAEKQDLVSISTAKIAPRDIASDLMKAHAIGEQCYSTFKDETGQGSTSKEISRPNYSKQTENFQQSVQE